MATVHPSPSSKLRYRFVQRAGDPRPGGRDVRAWTAAGFLCQTRGGGFMRKIGIIIGVILVLVVVAGLVFTVTFDVNNYRQTIQSQIQRKLGRPVTLGEMRLKLFPLRFRVDNLAIADDPKFSPDAPFLKAQQLDVSIKLLPLLRKQIEVNSLSLERPNINLIKNEAGIWNTASLGHPEGAPAGKPQAQPQPQPKQPAQPAAPSAPTETQAAGQQVTLSELGIRDGQIS